MFETFAPYIRRRLDYLRSLLPGFFFASIIALIATIVADITRVALWGTFMQAVSPVSLALVLGILASPAVKRSRAIIFGLRFCTNHLLKFAIILIGFRLSLSDIARVGLSGLPVVASAILCSLALCFLLARILRVNERLTLLIAFGSSICGVSAIMAASSVNGAKEKEITYSVAIISLFGFLSLLISPLVANALFNQSEWAAGLFIGSSVHDTAQVAGAALFYEQFYHAVSVIDVAMVAKMMRNMAILVLIPLTVLWINRSASGESRSKFGLGRVFKLFPPFMLGFLCTSTVRTIGDINEQMAFGEIRANTWWLFLENIDLFSTYIITIATAAIGASSDFVQLRLMGWRPLFLGFAAAFCTGASAAMVLFLTI